MLVLDTYELNSNNRNAIFVMISGIYPLLVHSLWGSSSVLVWPCLNSQHIFNFIVNFLSLINSDTADDWFCPFFEMCMTSKFYICAKQEINWQIALEINYRFQIYMILTKHFKNVNSTTNLQLLHSLNFQWSLSL